MAKLTKFQTLLQVHFGFSKKPPTVGVLEVFKNVEFSKRMYLIVEISIFSGVKYKKPI